MGSHEKQNFQFKLGFIQTTCVVINNEQELNLITPFVKFNIIVNNEENFDIFATQLSRVNKFIFVDCLPLNPFYGKFNCTILEALPPKGCKKCFDVFDMFEQADANEIFCDVLQNIRVLKTKPMSVVNLTRKIITNDIEFVKDFYSTYNNVLCYIPELGIWTKFNKCAGWQEIPNKTITIAVTELVNKHIALLNKDNTLSYDEQAKYTNTVKTILTVSKMNRIIELIKTECTVSLNQFINNNSIAFLNGVLNFLPGDSYSFDMFNPSQKIMDHRTSVMFNCKEELTKTREIINCLLGEDELNPIGIANAMRTALRGNNPKIYVIHVNRPIETMLLEAMVVALGDYAAKIYLQNGNITVSEMRSLMFKRVVIDKNFDPNKIKKILSLKQLIGSEPLYINGSKKINLVTSVFIINNKFRDVDFLKNMNINENLIEFIDMRQTSQIVPNWELEDFDNAKKTILDFIINFRHN